MLEVLILLHLILCIVLHCLQTQQDQQKLRTLLAGIKSEQVSAVFQHSKWQFPYHPWIVPRISPGLPETLCVCTGLSENPHTRGAEVFGVPPCLLSAVQCLFKNSCHSITVNGESLHQVEPSDNQNSDEEYVCVCTYHCESHASHMYAAAHTQCFQWLYKISQTLPQSVEYAYMQWALVASLVLLSLLQSACVSLCTACIVYSSTSIYCVLYDVPS